MAEKKKPKHEFIAADKAAFFIDEKENENDRTDISKDI